MNAEVSAAAVNPLGLSSESSDPSTWGTGVKMAIHSLLTGAQNLR